MANIKWYKFYLLPEKLTFKNHSHDTHLLGSNIPAGNPSMHLAR